MSRKNHPLTKIHVCLILTTIWLLSNLGDRLWLALDSFPPGWDQSNHLTISLRYLQAIQAPQLFNGEWWRNFWMISPKYPPLTYIFSAFSQQIFGKGHDQALLINFFFTGILFVSVYFLGKILFTREIGLWAAGLTALLPRLYQVKIHYLLDIPTMVMTVASFTCLTYWHHQKSRQAQWWWTLIFGLCWGIALMVKQSVMFFLTIPLLALLIRYLWQRQWGRIGQLIMSFMVSILVWGWWYRTNWIYLFSTVQNSNAIPAALEGDPAINTLNAWVYYWNDLPGAISWCLLLIPIVGLLLTLLGYLPKSKDIPREKLRKSLLWLTIYWIGSYLICSAITNKDARYIMPYLPILAIFLAYSLTRWRGRWQPVRWVAIALSGLVLVGKLFPVPLLEDYALAMSPGWLSHPRYYPSPAIIEKVLETAPYQKSNIGVIPSIEPINHNTVNYLGSLQDFHVSGRELGNRPESVLQDHQNFDWLISQPHCRGSSVECNGLARDTQIVLGDELPNDSDFTSINTWDLPDENDLQLFRRRLPQVEVKPLADSTTKIQLKQVVVPERIPAGYPVPVTYHWVGTAEELEKGLVLLNWESVENPEYFWIHDHAIAFGELALDNDLDRSFEIIERTAMLPPDNFPQGNYQLKAKYFDRETQDIHPLNIPNTIISLDPNASIIDAPPLDAPTQLRQLALNLPQGVKALEPIFLQVDHLNRYDPRQDYLLQTEQSLDYRLSQNAQSFADNWRYGLFLSQVLQEDPRSSIETIRQIVKHNPQNPYNHAYLAFIYLYNWQPKLAREAIEPALKLAPEIQEIQLLKGISELMQLRLIQGWKTISVLSLN